MKGKAYGKYGKRRNGVLHKGGKIKKYLKHGSPLNNLPLAILRQLALYLYGYDALGFAEFSSMVLMNSERDFWRNIGSIWFRTRRQSIRQMYPRNGYYLTLPGQFVQLGSDRIYNRFIFNGFSPERLLFLMNTCQCEGFQTYARLHSYSSHEITYNMPIFSFFEYSFMYQIRYFNSIERNLFSVCRHGCLEERNIVVDDIKMFERNLNNRFGFCYIKSMINFGLFVLAGGAVLNCLLISGFDASLQDLDFFWIGGFWISFINAIERFKRKAFSQILEETNTHEKVFEFVLLIENGKKIRIQFIFARWDANIPFILYTFDLDIVQVAYDGGRIISTIGFFQAVSTKSFLCYKLTNNIVDAPSYVDRCLKYNARGFTWICPIAYNQTLAQKPLIGMKKVVDYGFDGFYYNVDSFHVQDNFLRLNLFQ